MSRFKLPRPPLCQGIRGIFGSLPAASAIQPASVRVANPAPSSQQPDFSGVILKLTDLRDASGRSRTWVWAAGAMLVLVLAALACGFGPKLPPAIIRPTATGSATAAPVASTVPSSTRTPIPEATATPMPAWVADFAQPILLQVAGQAPDIQDTFDDNSGGWHCCKNCIRDSSLEFTGGELLLDPCTLTRGNLAFADFVLELDLHFLASARSNDTFRIMFRNQVSAEQGVPEAYKIFISPFGSIDVYLPPFDREKIELNVELPSQRSGPDHIVLIARGARIAFLYNGTPVTYFEDSSILRRGGLLFETYNGAAIDNLKIWDLANIADP